MADSTLESLRIKVRRLTKTPSNAQLTNVAINEYINRFVLYEMPSCVQLFNLKIPFSFYSSPYIDTYTTSSDPASALFNFKNKYLTVETPIYVAGQLASFFQDRTSFYNLYPNTRSVERTGLTGDGATAAFSSTIPSMLNRAGSYVLLRNSILLSSVDALGNALAMVDYPINATTGNLYAPGGVPTSTVAVDANNNINYITGVYTVTFSAAPKSGAEIYSQTVVTQPGMPTNVLFANDTFVLRPVPDKTYQVECIAYMLPTELLLAGSVPDLDEWWEYIAYGAARKVLQDRLDMETVMVLEPEFRRQECLIQRRMILQQSGERTATIYTQPNSLIEQ